MTGQCQNGGCQRLGTEIVIIDGLGKRHLCYHCRQALDGLGIIRSLPVLVRRSLGGAA